MADSGREAGSLDEVLTEVSHSRRRRPTGIEHREPNWRTGEQPPEARSRHLFAGAFLVLKPKKVFLAMAQEVEHAGRTVLESWWGELTLELLKSGRKHPRQADRDQ